MANPNFNVKLTLDEANDVAWALREALGPLVTRVAINSASDEERERAGRIETLLRRDFGRV